MNFESGQRRNCTRCVVLSITPSPDSLDTYQLSGPSTDILGAHRSSRAPRLPRPYDLLNRANSPSEASRIRSAMSDSSSITSSSTTTGQALIEANLGDGLRHKAPPKRKSGAKSRKVSTPAVDKDNRDRAGAILIARLCNDNCWPQASSKRNDNIEEALLQANAEATSHGRTTTPTSKAICLSVSLSSLQGTKN